MSGNEATRGAYAGVLAVGLTFGLALARVYAFSPERCIHQATLIHKLDFRGSRGMETPCRRPEGTPGTRPPAEGRRIKRTDY